MTSVVRSHRILVRSSMQTAFDCVADLTRHPEWSSGQLRITAVAPGPVGPGKEYVSHGKVAVQKNRRNTLRITEYAPPHRFSFVANDPDFGIVSHVFTFVEQRGEVPIERTIRLSPHPAMALLFGLLIYPLTGKPAMDKSLARLKARLEEGVK